MRTSTSVDPPGGQGTITRTVRLGHSPCASAGVARRPAEAARIVRRVVMDGGSREVLFPAGISRRAREGQMKQRAAVSRRAAPAPPCRPGRCSRSCAGRCACAAHRWPWRACRPRRCPRRPDGAAAPPACAPMPRPGRGVIGAARLAVQRLDPRIHALQRGGEDLLAAQQRRVVSGGGARLALAAPRAAVRVHHAAQPVAVLAQQARQRDRILQAQSAERRMVAGRDQGEVVAKQPVFGGNAGGHGSSRRGLRCGPPSREPRRPRGPGGSAATVPGVPALVARAALAAAPRAPRPCAHRRHGATAQAPRTRCRGGRATPPRGAMMRP